MDRRTFLSGLLATTGIAQFTAGIKIDFPERVIGSVEYPRGVFTPLPETAVKLRSGALDYADLIALPIAVPAGEKYWVRYHIPGRASGCLRALVA